MFYNLLYSSVLCHPGSLPMNKKQVAHYWLTPTLIIQVPIRNIIKINCIGYPYYSVMLSHCLFRQLIWGN